MKTNYWRAFLVLAVIAPSIALVFWKPHHEPMWLIGWVSGAATYLGIRLWNE